MQSEDWVAKNTKHLFCNRLFKYPSCESNKGLALIGYELNRYQLGSASRDMLFCKVTDISESVLAKARPLRIR